MENELLKTFDEDGNLLGVATREEVHRMGFWHESFHCWFVSEENDVDYLYLQLRSAVKKDYPNLLDITAAGHLLASETVKDGVREIKEEVGIDVNFNELVSLGIIPYSVIKEGFIDKEIANVYLYKFNKSLEDFTLQEEEVAGMVKVAFSDFKQLWLGNQETIQIKGFKVEKNGYKTTIDEKVGREKFVPHQLEFYKTLIQKINENI